MEYNKKPYTDENGEIYFSIKKLSYILGVDYYNDEYKSKGEDPTKCYIKTENEYTSFISNSILSAEFAFSMKINLNEFISSIFLR